MAAPPRQHHRTSSVENSVRPRSRRVSGVEYVIYALAILCTLVVCGIGSRGATGAGPGSTSPPATGGGATSDQAVCGGESSETVDATKTTTPVGEAASGPPAPESTSGASASPSKTSDPEMTASATTSKARLTAMKKKLRLNIPSSQSTPEVPGDMAPVVKHSCLKNFSEMVAAIPKNASLREKARSLVDAIESCSIKAVCADFDRTMLTIHTGGAWSSTKLADLKGKLSQDFIVFAQELNKRRVPLHVVTFSDRWVTAPGREVAGENLVREALAANDDPFEVESIIGFRPDVYSDRARFASLGLDAPPARNKSYHIQKVADTANLNVDEILLIDDDRVNCSAHFKTGNLALFVGGDGFGFDNIVPVTTSSII